ncbi:hypothetical protein ACLOJK_024645 [Asimina triloba]
MLVEIGVRDGFVKLLLLSVEDGGSAPPADSRGMEMGFMVDRSPVTTMGAIMNGLRSSTIADGENDGVVGSLGRHKLNLVVAEFRAAVIAFMVMTLLELIKNYEDEIGPSSSCF